MELSSYGVLLNLLQMTRVLCCIVEVVPGIQYIKALIVLLQLLLVKMQGIHM